MGATSRRRHESDARVKLWREAINLLRIETGRVFRVKKNSENGCENTLQQLFGKTEVRTRRP